MTSAGSCPEICLRYKQNTALRSMMLMVLRPIIFRLTIGAEFFSTSWAPVSALFKDLLQTLRILPAVHIVCYDLNILGPGYA
jgi:hypothetical protein